jgi:hypothetical protein
MKSCVMQDMKLRKFKEYHVSNMVTGKEMDLT